MCWPPDCSVHVTGLGDVPASASGHLLFSGAFCLPLRLAWPSRKQGASLNTTSFLSGHCVPSSFPNPKDSPGASHTWVLPPASHSPLGVAETKEGDRGWGQARQPWLRKAGRDAWDLNTPQISAMYTSDHLGQASRRGLLNPPPSYTVNIQPRGAPVGWETEPPRRQPADGCDHPKLRARLGRPGSLGLGPCASPATPFSAFQEVGPLVPSLGFVFLNGSANRSLLAAGLSQSQAIR